MEFQADYAVSDINEAGAFIFFNNLVAAFEIGQQDDLGIFVNLGIALLFKVVVIFAVCFGCIERFTTFLQHFIDLLGNFQFQLLHDFDSFFDAHGIPHLEGTQLIIVAPFHGVIDGHDVIADFTNPVGRIDEGFAQIRAREITGLVICIEHMLNGVGNIFHLFRGGNRVKLRLAGGNIFHRIDIQHQLNCLAAGILGFLVISLLGLVAQPFVCDHFLQERFGLERIPCFIVGNGIIEVFGDMVSHIETDEIHRSENGRARMTEGLADDRVYFINLHLLFQHDFDDVGQIKHADAVADKVRAVFTNNHTLAQCFLAEFHHEIHNVFICFRAGNDFHEFHVARRIEEMGSQKTFFQSGTELRADVFNGNTGGVCGNDTGRFDHFFHFGKKFLLDFEILHDNLA